MSLWTRLNQPIGSSGKAKAEAKTAAKASKPSKPGKPSKPSKAERGSRGAAQDASAGDHAATGTATAVLEPAPPAEKAAGKRGGRGTTARRTSSASTSSAVNLLSPWVMEELAVRRLRLRFLAAGVALVIGVAGTWGMLRMQLHGTNENLRGEDAVTAGLQDQMASLNDVRTYVGAVSGRSTEVEETMASHVEFSQVFERLQMAMPDGAVLTGLSVTLPAEPMTIGGEVPEGAAEDTGLCRGADPFGTRTVVGCIELTGVADSREQVGLLLQALAGDQMFVEPFVNDTATSLNETLGANLVKFTGTIGVSPKAVGKRFEGLFDPSPQATDPAAEQSAEQSTAPVEETP